MEVGLTVYSCQSKNMVMDIIKYIKTYFPHDLHSILDFLPVSSYEGLLFLTYKRKLSTTARCRINNTVVS
jgi:hypothetical protein